MRRAQMAVIVAAVSAGLVAVAATSAHEPRPMKAAKGTVYVTERSLGSVTAYDGATGRALWTQRTGATPIGVTRPRWSQKLYTSDEGSNQMSVFDARSGTPLTTIPMGPLPHHLMASRDGRRIYVGEFGQDTVGVIDTFRDRLIAHYDTSDEPNVRTHSVFVTADGRDLYTANTRALRTEKGDVAHLDARTGERLCNTAVGIDPSEVLVTRSGDRGYVSVRGENKVKELDLGGRCPVLTGREAVVGTQPDTLRLTPDGRTLVVTLRGTPAQISLLDTCSFAVRLVDIPGHLTTGHHWLSRRGDLSFVAVENPAGYAVVDNRAGTVVAESAYPDPPGGNRAHGVYFEPQRWHGWE